MANIINRNTVLPCSRVRRFYTASDQQDYVVVEVHQGENTYAQDNLLLGKIEISDSAKTKGKRSGGCPVYLWYQRNSGGGYPGWISTGVVKHILFLRKFRKQN